MKPQRSQRNLKNFKDKYPLKDITGRIISCGLEVHTRLGPGLLEKLYENALAYEFDVRKIMYERQKEINLQYKSHPIGQHRIDFLVENEIVVELKAVETIHDIYQAQLLTYLKAMNKKVGLLLNFNVERLKNGIKRLII